MLIYSGLRGVGEAVKAINKNLLTCGYAQAYARCARDRVFIGEGDGKVGRNEKKVGEGGEGWGERGAEGE